MGWIGRMKKRQVRKNRRRKGRQERKESGRVGRRVEEEQGWELQIGKGN
jgi:hypothetical protein